MISNCEPPQKVFVSRPITGIDQLMAGDHVPVILESAEEGKSLRQRSYLVYEGRTKQGEISFLDFNDAPQNGIVGIRVAPENITIKDKRVRIPLTRTTRELYQGDTVEYFKKKSLMEGHSTR